MPSGGSNDLMTTLPILRRSAMQTATSCLHRYKAIWLDGVPDQSDLASVGIGFHACAHRYIARLVQQGLTADAEEAGLAFTGGIASSLTPARLVPQVRTIYERWAERFELDLPHFLAAEEHQIGKTDQTFTPDLVYGRPTGLEIKDFKTFWCGMTEAQVRADFQARFYIYNAMRIWPGFPSYTFTQEYVRFGTSTSVQFTNDDFHVFRVEVEAVMAAVQEAETRGEWPATAGPECAYCELRCPLADHPAVLPKRFTIPEQASLVGSWILAAETQLKGMKKALKAYCAAHGAVNVKGVEFAHRPVELRSYPLEDVIRVLKARKAEEMSGLTISHSALAKLMKADPRIESDLLLVQQSKTSYRFGPKKLEESEDDED